MTVTNKVEAFLKVLEDNNFDSYEMSAGLKNKEGKFFFPKPVKVKGKVLPRPGVKITIPSPAYDTARRMSKVVEAYAKNEEYAGIVDKILLSPEFLPDSIASILKKDVSNLEVLKLLITSVVYTDAFVALISSPGNHKLIEKTDKSLVEGFLKICDVKDKDIDAELKNINDIVMDNQTI